MIRPVSVSRLIGLPFGALFCVRSFNDPFRYPSPVFFAMIKGGTADGRHPMRENMAKGKRNPSRRMEAMNVDLTILYEQDEAGWWIAEIPEVAGVFAQGRTPEEARTMVFDALQLMLESRRADAAGKSSASRRELLHLAA